jgi:bile acid:Na+ symporter, BASS family
MQQFVDLCATIVTLLLLVAVGMDLAPTDFRRVRDRAGMVAAGVLLPPLLLPLLAVGLIAVVRPSPIIASGLLLLAACPIGGVSNAYSALARASTALSVTLTAVSCAAALVTIPLATTLLEWLMQRPMFYSASPRTVLQQLIGMLLPTISLGMWLRARWPDLVARHHGAVQRSAFSLLIALLALVIASAANQVDIHWPSAVELAVLFVAAAFVAGGAIAWGLGGTPDDRFTFAAEFSTRNVAFALALAVSLGRQREFLWFGGLYLAVEIPMLSAAALLHRRLVGRTGGTNVAAVLSDGRT